MRSVLQRRHASGLLCAFCSAAMLAPLTAQVLIKEIVSREHSLQIGGIQDPLVKEAVSREVSFYVEQGPAGYPEVVSREHSLVVTSDAAPPFITDIAVTVSPTGDAATLDWSAYDQWAVGDILRFDIYTTDVGGFTDVTGMTPVRSVPNGATTVTLDGLAEFTDHFFAVVAVDALGNFDTFVDYAAAYVITPELASREVSIHVGNETVPAYQEVVSREVSLVVTSPDPPAPIDEALSITIAPTGESVLLNWSAYDQWAERDIVGFDIYLSDAGPFTDVSEMVPFFSVPAETTTLLLDGLTTFTDHFLAVVPVDALGNFDPVVAYSAAYVLTPEVASREVSLHVGNESTPAFREIVSREYSLVVPDQNVPEPVTGLDSGFTAATSMSDFGAVDLDWTSYNELAQVDILRYRIYVGDNFFDDVTGLEPFSFVPAGMQLHTVSGLPGNEVFHFAVVAEDVLGNFDPSVRSFSAQTSVSSVGEVVNLAAASSATSILFTWDPPDGGAFLREYHLYFDGAETPLVLPNNAISWEATGLAPASGHSLRIATVDLFNEEGDGASLLAATLLPNPANPSLTLINGEVAMHWDTAEPDSLVSLYAVYQSSTPITDLSGLTPLVTTPATEAALGPLATVMNEHFAVATININGSTDPAVVSVQASKAGQTIDFPAPPPALSIPLAATASSGLPVRFEVAPGSLATITGDPGSQTLTALRGGNVTITAYQDGNADYWPAPPVSHIVRLPPVIASFTADGSEITPATVITRIDTLLRVVGQDENGISQAAFSIRPVGGSFASLGVDDVAVDGFTANLALDSLPDGDYELRAEITAALTGESTSTIRPVRIELAPPAPPTITSPVNGTVVTNDSVLIEGVSSRETEVFLDRDGLQVAGPLTPNGGGNFSATASLLPGPNLFTARATNRAGASGNSTAVTVTLQSTLTLALAPPSFTEGESSTLTIGRSNSQGPLTIGLSQSVPGQLQLAAQVSFADGVDQVTTPVTAVDDDVPEIDQGVTITAQAANYSSGSTLATVIDDDRPTLTLAVNRSVVSESAGAGALVATVTRTPINNRSFTVALSTSDPTAIQVPASLSIAPFTASASVGLVVIDDDLLDGDQAATLTARIFDVTSGELLAASNPVDITVTDDDGPALALRLARDSVQEGEMVTAFITRNSGIDQPLSVALAVDRPTEASVQTTVDFPGGAEEVSVQVSGLDDGVTDGNQSVLLEASAPGLATAQAELVVTDERKPDLTVTNLSAPTPVLTDEWVNYTYRIENHGPVDATSAISIRVSLSSDPVAGEDTELNTFTFDAGLPAGLFFERTETFRTPIEAGTYWIVVEVDGEDVHREILETNNAGVSNPMVVGAAYEATVSTDTTVAPSGTPIPLSGQATNVSDGSPAAFKLVNVQLMVRDTKRILSALTNSAGAFALTFNPLPGEGGSYTIGATHPGVADAGVQDSFTLLGIGTDTPQIELTATRGEAESGQFTIRNLADVAISGIQIAGTGFPADVTLTGNLEGGRTTLGPLEETTLDYEFTALPGAPSPAEGNLTITSAEGAALAIPLTATIRELESLLVSARSRLERGMVPGEQNFVNFSIRNEGSVPTGPIRILLPAAPWLSSATQSPMPSLPPGQSADVSLKLTPAADLPLTAYSGSVQLVGAHNTLTLPFTFRALGNATGDLVVRCEDEFTYFADTAPPLQGATVTILDAVDGSLVAAAISDLSGEASFSDIREGYYKIEATAPDHTTFRKTIFLESGQSNFVRAFLSRQLVQYIWNVVPTEIQDRYRIVVESVFETNVPAPVVEIRPSFIDLRDLTQEVTQIDLTITNHGLIAANNVGLNFASTEDWEVTPLVDNVGTLSAKSSLTIPLIIRNLSGEVARNGACSAPRGRVDWAYKCGNWNVGGSAGVGFAADTRDCPGGRITPRGGGAGGIISPSPVSSSGVVSCDPCILKALIDCGFGFVPDPFFGCGYAAGGLFGDIALNGVSSSTALDATQAGLGCACNFTPYGPVCNTVNCFIDILQCIADNGSGEGGRQDYAAILQRFEDRGRGVVAMVDFELALLGDEAWRPFLDHEHMTAFMTLYREAMLDSSDGGRPISAAERTDLLASDLVPVVGTGLAEALLDRWNRTVTYYESGIFNSTDVPAGSNPDFLAFDLLLDAATRLRAAYEAVFPEGFDDPMEAFHAAKDDLFAFLSSGDGVCARVRLRIEQEAVMTRDAFAASLDIINNDTAPLTGVEVSLRVTDADGADATSLFGVVGPDVSGVSGDSIAAETTGSWRWTLVPSQDAAPDDVTEYFVEGRMSYVQDGLTVNVPLSPQQITVYPNPRLYLKYFHQRDVYSDDPFTDPIEPSIPFSLGVMVENRGAGTARNFQIASAQPEIIENDKGLLIDFSIIASQVAGQNLSPSLTANFGDIAPGDLKVARWLLTSTLQGLFIEYDASFEHLDALGDERLSLIESVEIHETIHEIRALGAKDDVLPDFFTNDVADARDLGDTIHLSDGSTAPVSVVEAGTIDQPADGNLTVSLSAPGMGAGWSYLRIPDPGAGEFQVVRVTRSDGLEIPLDLNVWTTDRTFIGLGLRPVPEHLLHLVDCDSTGQYTVEYAIIPPPDTTPPTSSITMLADQSSAFIDLAWTGMDDGGVAFFDIYFSENGGLFQLWLEGTNATSALFTGNPGSTYSFYSVATDQTGNQEPPKSSGEAETTISLVNQPPELAIIPDQEIVEGEIFRYRLSATDPDGPDALLRYAITSTQPGLIVDPVSGWLTWVTGEQNGGSSISVTATVTDGDPDPKSASRSFMITVQDTNSAPVLTEPGSFTLDVGQSLQVQLEAEDADVPAQTITFNIVGTPPAGMTLDPTSGLLEWTPGDQHEDQSFEILLEARDDQIPPGVGDAVLYLDVLKKPGLPPEFEPFPLLVWQTEGQFFQEIVATDPEGEPVTITGDLSNLSDWAALHADPGTGRALLEWNTTGVIPGIYLVPLVAATDRQQTAVNLVIEVRSRAPFVDFDGWVGTFPLAPVERFAILDPNFDGIPNIGAYGFGIDPANGAGTAQPEPRLVSTDGTSYRLEFTMPTDGRFDLRYIVEQSDDLNVWTEIARKEGDGPWTRSAKVVVTPLRGPLARAAVIRSFVGLESAFLRLRMELIVP